MKKTKIILTAILLAASTWLAKSQSCSNSCSVSACEYVCNGGFESYSVLPTAISQTWLQQIGRACGWINGNNATTPDYYHALTTNSVVGVPCNMNGKEPERTFQNAYAGFYIENATTWSERIASKLTTTLNMSSSYEVSFWLSLGEVTAYNELNNVGFTLAQSSGPGFSIVNTINIVNTSSVTANGWSKITYTVDYNHMSAPPDYIVVGSFQDITGVANSFSLASGGTSTITCPGFVYNPTDPNSSYYFIDDISIREILPINATASSTTGCAGEVFTLTATGVNTYTWNPGNIVGSTATVTPSSTTVYTVTGTSSAGCVVAPATVTITPAACCTNTNAGAIHLRNVTLVAYNTPGATTWTSLATGSFYTGNIAVPSPTSGTSIITNTLSVIGGLTVNTPVTFSLSNIFFTEDSPLNQNYDMKIDRSWLRGCGKMWEGIVSKATLTVTNSFIEDAFQGINAGLWYALPTHPGLIVDNSVFLKNWAGIAVGSCSMNPSPATFKITGCVFMSRNVSDGLHDFAVGKQYNSTLLPLYAKTPAKLLASTAHGVVVNTIRSYMGVYVPGLISNTGSPMFTIGGVGIDQPATDKLTNMFDYMNAGIYNTNSKINVYNCKFGNMINTGVGNAMGAIYHNDGASNYKNTITVVGGSTQVYYKNVFGFEITTQILDAVVAVNGGQVDVKYNDFKNITRYGVSIQNWAAFTPSVEPVNVANNSFTNAAYAFYAYNNQGITATVTTNTVTNSTTTYTNNSNVYIDDVGKVATSTFYINNNTLKTSLNGVYARNAQNVRVVDNTIEVARPTSTSIFNGAVWFDNVDNGFVKLNQISCNPSNATSYNTFGVFANASKNNKYKCNTITKVSACMKFQSNCAPSYNYNNSFNNTSGADPCLYGIWLDNGGQTGDVGYLNGTTWEAANIFWGDFSVADTKAQASSNYTYQASIYYNSASTPTADYRPLVNINTYNPLALPPDNSQSYIPVGTSNALSDNLCNEAARYSNQPRLVKGATTLPGVDDGSNEVVLKKQILLPVNENQTNNNSTYKVIKGANEANFYAVDSLIATYVSTKNASALSNAKNINAVINASNNQEQNLKDFNAVYAVFVEDDSLVTSNQINYLHNLALLCPFTEGLSVYEARGLMRTWDDSTFYYNPCENNIPDELNISSRFANGLNESANSIVIAVYPNPTNGSLNVKINAKDCIFEVYDLIGKKVMYQKLNENETKVDVSSLNSGTYLYKILQNGALLKADKLILNK